jgi:transposase
MYLRQTRRSNKDGSDAMYFQIAENAWSKANKRSEVKVIHNFGRVDAESELRLRKLAESILKRLNGGATGEEADMNGDECKIQSAHNFGGIYALQQLWEKLGLKDSILDRLKKTKHSAPLERALSLMVANRCLAPSSKLYCFEQWMAEDIYFPEAKKLQLHHFYRALDFLEECKPDLEKSVFFKIADLFNTDVELVFYDTTSVHFEVDDEDEEGDDQLRVRGYSKNGRSDAPQVVVGLAMTRDGLPVRSWVFPGNTVDSSTVKQVKADLRGWNLTRCVFVGDAGMVSEENLRELSLGGGRYIVGNPLRRELEIRAEVLTRKGRYAEVQTATGRDNLKVKEVIVGDGERARRYILCFNPQEAARQAQRREQLLEHLETELKALEKRADDHPKKACELLASRRYGKYLRKLKDGRLKICQASVKDAARTDGKWVLRTNDDTLSAEDVAQAYKHLLDTECAWRQMKSVLKVRPVYHWNADRIRAHVTVCVLALLLIRIAENECGDTWRTVRDSLQLQKAVVFSGPSGSFTRTTELRPETGETLKRLGLDPPKQLLKVD